MFKLFGLAIVTLTSGNTDQTPLGGLYVNGELPDCWHSVVSSCTLILFTTETKRVSEQPFGRV